MNALLVLIGIAVGALVAGMLCKLIVEELRAVHAEALQRVTLREDAVITAAYNNGFDAGVVARPTVQS